MSAEDFKVASNLQAGWPEAKVDKSNSLKNKRYTGGDVLSRKGLFSLETGSARDEGSHSIDMFLSSELSVTVSEELPAAATAAANSRSFL